MPHVAIVENARVQDARDLCVAAGDGPGTFSVALSTSPNETNPANATHWGMEGTYYEAVLEALQLSVDPMVNLTETDGSGFNTVIASRVPALYKVNEPL